MGINVISGTGATNLTNLASLPQEEKTLAKRLLDRATSLSPDPSNDSKLNEIKDFFYRGLNSWAYSMAKRYLSSAPVSPSVSCTA